MGKITKIIVVALILVTSFLIYQSTAENGKDIDKEYMEETVEAEGVEEKNNNNQEEEETQKVLVYFATEKTGAEPDFDCAKVSSTEREISKTLGVGKAALEELLRGPTNEEKAAGFISAIPENVAINSLKVEEKIAYVDFEESLQYQVGGSCRVGTITAQISETLKQFSSVDSVVISIEGQTEDILQP